LMDNLHLFHNRRLPTLARTFQNKSAIGTCSIILDNKNKTTNLVVGSCILVVVVLNPPLASYLSSDSSSSARHPPCSHCYNMDPSYVCVCVVVRSSLPPFVPLFSLAFLVPRQLCARGSETGGGASVRWLQADARKPLGKEKRSRRSRSIAVGQPRRPCG
jgi:hypothetical protein